MLKFISIHYGHNATVAFSNNGEIISIVSEERFSRLKNHTGFPEKALNYTLNKYLNGNFEEVDKIILVDNFGLDAKYLYKNNYQNSEYISFYSKIRDKINQRKFFYDHLKYFYKLSKKIKFFYDKNILKNNFKEELYKKYNLPKNKIVSYDHHLSHAASFCYFDTKKTNPTIVFSMDGEGDYKSSTVNICQEGELKLVSENSNQVSLGYLYLFVTAYLGLKPGEHEFKVMGLSPYGNKNRSDFIKKKLNDLIQLNKEGTFESITDSGNLIFELMDIFSFERFDDIARATQEFLEEIVVNWVIFWCEKLNIFDIAVSGGVFMNIKLNMILHQNRKIKSFFAVPSCTDDSLPIGGLYLENLKEKIKIKELSHLYLGRNYNNEDIKKHIEVNNLTKEFEINFFNETSDLNERVSGLLKENKIVARFAGREEWGARALGNRSILCNPEDIGNINLINSLVKKRDFWMPFTPTIQREFEEEYFENPKKINGCFMSSAFISTLTGRERLKAAIHPKDYTIRPQILDKKTNPDYYDLIDQFRLKTGVGALLNTSFNLSGEPNVSSLMDATKTVLNCGIEYFVLENYLLKKINPN